jgi:hypothetical protein
LIAVTKNQPLDEHENESKRKRKSVTCSANFSVGGMGLAAGKSLAPLVIAFYLRGELFFFWS